MKIEIIYFTALAVYASGLINNDRSTSELDASDWKEVDQYLDATGLHNVISCGDPYFGVCDITSTYGKVVDYEVHVHCKGREPIIMTVGDFKRMNMELN